MTTYNTGNPLGSTAVKDLYDNAQNLDVAVNSSAQRWVDRLGVSRWTLQGIDAEAARRLDALGYTGLDNVYAAGLVLTSRSELVLRSGEYFRLAPGAPLPYTLTGNWVTDAPNLVGVGDAALRSELSATGGVGLVSGAIAVVNSFAQLRALPKTTRNLQTLLSINGSTYQLDLSDTTTADNGGRVIVATDGGRWKLLQNSPMSFAQFETLAQAVSSGEKNLRLTSTVTVTASQTWPNGMTISVENGGVISVASGQTLTIRGSVKADEVQVFTGAGTVVGVADVRPEWFGAGLTGNDTAAITKAQRCIEASMASDGESRILFGQKEYFINQPIKAFCNLGPRIKWHGQGAVANTTITVLNTWGGTTDQAALLFGIDDTNSNGASFEVKGFRLRSQNPLATADRGLVFGDSAIANMNGGNHSSCIVEDVFVLDFKVCWDFVHCRLLSVHRCSGWVINVPSGICRRIRAISPGRFTGDMEFHNCVWEASATGAESTRMEAINPGTSVSGVRMLGDIFYYGAFNILSQLQGAIYDVWLHGGFQLDAMRAFGVTIAAVGSGSFIANVNIRNGYFGGDATSSQQMVNAFSADSGRVERVHVDGNSFLNTRGTVIQFESCHASSVNDNTFTNTAGTDVKLILANNGFCNTFDNNVVVPGYLFVYSIVTISGSADYFTARGNKSTGTSAAAVAVTATGTHFTVDGNF